MERQDSRPEGWASQPKYKKIVRIGPRRWGMTTREPDGRLAVREILGHARFEFR